MAKDFEEEAVTEAEWLGSFDFKAMVRHVRGEASHRKALLYACACCRHIWHLSTDKSNRTVVETVELFSEGTEDERAVCNSFLARHARKDCGRAAI